MALWKDNGGEWIVMPLLMWAYEYFLWVVCTGGMGVDYHWMKMAVYEGALCKLGTGDVWFPLLYTLENADSLMDKFMLAGWLNKYGMNCSVLAISTGAGFWISPVNPLQNVAVPSNEVTVAKTCKCPAVTCHFSLSSIASVFRRRLDKV